MKRTVLKTEACFKFMRKCRICGETQTYKSKAGYTTAKRKNTMCRQCSNEFNAKRLMHLRKNGSKNQTSGYMSISKDSESLQKCLHCGSVVDKRWETIKDHEKILLDMKNSLDEFLLTQNGNG